MNIGNDYSIPMVVLYVFFSLWMTRAIIWTYYWSKNRVGLANMANMVKTMKSNLVTESEYITYTTTELPGETIINAKRERVQNYGCLMYFLFLVVWPITVYWGTYLEIKYFILETKLRRQLK